MSDTQAASNKLRATTTALAPPTLPPSYLCDGDAQNLLPAFAVERLLDNGGRIAMAGNDDVELVVKLFTPDAG